jgi:hypothetical protein
MRLHIHRAERRRIDRWFEADLDSSGREFMLAALNACPKCAAYYRELQMLESSLCGADEPYTHFSIERINKALWTAQIAPNRSTKELMTPRFRLVFAPAAAIVTAAFVLFLLYPTVPPSDRIDIPSKGAVSPVTLVARGAFPQKAESDVGIRLFRAVEGGAAVAEGKDLSINDIVTFTYTQANQPGGQFMLFGIQDTGEVRWYYPSYGETSSIAVNGDKVDEPLKDGILLRVNHMPGRLRVTALFSKRPVATSDVEAAVAAMRQNPGQIMNLSPIPLAKDSTPSIQYSVIVQIGEGK